MEKIFTDVYEKNIWGSNNNCEYNGSSGEGSSVEYNNIYISFLKKFITVNNIKNIVDFGCGDFRCGSLIYDDLNIIYTGYDVYEKLIKYNSKTHFAPKYTFHNLDFCNNKEKIIGGDMCVLKDVIQHWSLDNIYSFLDYIIEKKLFKYILICNCDHQRIDNTNIVNGDFRPLSCDFFPLKKYNPKKIFRYHTKEVCIIVE